MPSSDANSDWLRRMGANDSGGLASLQRVNRCVLRRLLRNDTRTDYTLDIDVTQIVAEKREAWYGHVLSVCIEDSPGQSLFLVDCLAGSPVRWRPLAESQVSGLTSTKQRLDQTVADTQIWQISSVKGSKRQFAGIGIGKFGKTLESPSFGARYDPGRS